MLICETRDKKFVNRLGLNRHLRSHIHQTTSKKLRFENDKTFFCRQNMNRHTREFHDYVGHKSVKHCPLCPFKTNFILQLSFSFKKVLNEPAIINLPTEQEKRGGFVRKPLKKLKCWTTAIEAENFWDLSTKNAI